MPKAAKRSRSLKREAMSRAVELVVKDVTHPVDRTFHPSPQLGECGTVSLIHLPYWLTVTPLPRSVLPAWQLVMEPERCPGAAQHRAIIARVSGQPR